MHWHQTSFRHNPITNSTAFTTIPPLHPASRTTPAIGPGNNLCASIGAAAFDERSSETYASKPRGGAGLRAASRELSGESAVQPVWRSPQQLPGLACPAEDAFPWGVAAARACGSCARTQQRFGRCANDRENVTAEGLPLSHYRAARRMQVLGLVSSRQPTHRYQKAEQPHLDIPIGSSMSLRRTRSGTGNITHIWSARRRAYLALVPDLFARHPEAVDGRQRTGEEGADDGP